MVVQEFGIPLEAFFDEAQAFGNSATLHVTNGTAYLDSMKMPFSEGVIYEGLARFCYYAFSLVCSR